MLNRAGRLDRQLVLQAVTETRSASGAVTQSWTTFATVWAELSEPSGREMMEAGGEQARIDRVFRIRWRDDVTAKTRALYEGVAHDIVSVKELGRRDGLELNTVAKQ